MYRTTVFISALLMSGCASTAGAERYCLNQDHVMGDWNELYNPPEHSSSMFFEFYKGRPDPNLYFQKWYRSDAEEILLCSAPKTRLGNNHRRYRCYVRAVLFNDDSPDARVLATGEIFVCTG